MTDIWRQLKADMVPIKSLDFESGSTPKCQINGGGSYQTRRSGKVLTFNKGGVKINGGQSLRSAIQ